MEALAKLACKCEGMVPGAVNLLLDMLNDEVEVVRGQAMQALSQLAMAGHMSVQEGHLHMVRLLHYSSLSLTLSLSMQRSG